MNIHRTKCRGHRDLSIVKVSGPYDAWRTKKRRLYGVIEYTGLNIQSALRAIFFSKKLFFLFFFSAFWLGTSTERNVGDVEIYRLSNFQVCTTLGGRRNAEKRKSIFKNFVFLFFRCFFVRQASYGPETLTIDRSRRP